MGGELSERWEYYSSSTGADPVGKAIGKANLSRTERARLVLLLNRVAAGTVLAGDIKKLTKTLWEVRLDGDGRIFRLIYADSISSGKPVLLGLVFFEKKSKKTPLTTIRTAEKRRKDWEGRQRP